MDRVEIEKGIQVTLEKAKVTEKLKRAGLPIPSKPKEVVENIDLFSEWEIIKNKHGGIANIPFNDLGSWLDKWSAMAAYARWTEAVADIKQTTSREVRDTVKKQLYTLQEGGREIRDAMVHVESLYIEWQNKFVEDSALYTAVKGLREGYEFRQAAISREITRRTGDAVRHHGA